MMPITIAIPLRLGTGQNMREHFRVRAKRVKAERHAVAWAANAKPRPPNTMPLVVHIVRVSPGTVPLDSDNLSGAGKAVRDQLADWLGRNDGHDSVTWTYGQRKGPWGVEITISERAA